MKTIRWSRGHWLAAASMTFVVGCSSSSGGDAESAASDVGGPTGSGGSAGAATGKGGSATTGKGGSATTGTGGSTSAGAGGSSTGKAGSGTSGGAGSSSGKAGGAGTGPGSGGAAGKGSGTGGGAGSGGDAGSAGAQGWQTSEDVELARVSVGGGEHLNLVKMRVTTHIEGLRARTIVDHVFQNPYAKALEGTFLYKLPVEAGVAYFGTFVGTSSGPASSPPPLFGPADKTAGLGLDQLVKLDPNDLAEKADAAIWSGLKPARVVRAVDATIAYEDVAIKKVDPALVEQVAPNTFSGRVYPIPAYGFNRIIMTYEQTLPRVGGELEYRLPIPKGVVPEIEIEIAATKGASAALASVGTVAGTTTESTEHFFFEQKITGTSPGGVVVLHTKPVDANPQADVVAGTDAQTGQSYAYARLLPDLPSLSQPDGGATHGVFVLDTSLSEHPDRFGVDVKLLASILASSPKMKSFKVMTFDAGARWLTSTWIPNDAASRDAIVAELGSVLLEGSTNFGAALRLLAAPTADLAGVPAADVFVLSDGAISWGDTSAENLVGEFTKNAPFAARFFAYRTGLGAENLELYSALTRRGAIFNCFSMDSVAACGSAHQATGATLTQVSIDAADGSGPAVDDLLVAGRQAMLFPGAYLTVAGRVKKPGPAIARLQGTSSAGPIDVSIPVDVSPTGALAPRAWAELAVSQIVGSHDPALEGLGMALSQRYGIASSIASFLMLETQQAYQQWNLQDETAKFQGQTIGGLIEAAYLAFSGSWTSWSRLTSAIAKFDKFNHVTTAAGGKLVASVTSGASDAELEVPVPTLQIPLVKKADVPGAYLASLSHDSEVVSPFLDEATRRRNDGQTGSAVRALSSLVENNPGNAQMERLVGYRMSGWGQATDASSLFFHVLERRPFEPQSYRDLANSLGVARPRVSALLYEAVAAGTWEQKHAMLVPVVKEEYSLFIDKLHATQPSHPLLPYLDSRRQALGLTSPIGDLRVTITWNTDDTDIDLWVVDPLGEKCFYSHKQTATGGKLLADLTQGYGPERFEAVVAATGKYQIFVNYYANHSNGLYAFSYVNVAVQRNLGKADETTDYYVVPMKKVGDTALVTEVSFKLAIVGGGASRDRRVEGSARAISGDGARDAGGSGRIVLA